jgi:bifunctional non-homologous end joining protein LigD
MKNVSLYFQEGNSDKEYHIQLEKSGDGFVVNFQYGRRGSNLSAGTKTPTPLPLKEADKVYESKLKEQLRKGYTEGEKKKNSLM